MNLKKCHQWLLQKQFVTKKDFVTAIGDIFTHVTAIADPWVGNGCHKGAHTHKIASVNRCIVKFGKTCFLSSFGKTSSGVVGSEVATRGAVLSLN